jgi:hypothetical protein
LQTADACSLPFTIRPLIGLLRWLLIIISRAGKTS